MAVRTTIIGLLFSPYFTIFVQLALAAATGKRCLQCFVNFAVLYTQNWVLTVFAKNATPNPFARTSGEGVTSLNPSSPWPPPRITESGSSNGDCDHVGLLSNIISKKMIGDILHIVVLVFSADILTLNVKIWWPGLVKRNYGQLVHNITVTMPSDR